MSIKKVYNQRNVSASFNGIDLKGLMDGASLTIERVGGEVEITEGTDGGGLNQATDQGVRVSLVFRETSQSIPTLETAKTLQQRTGVTSVLVVRTGANMLVTISNAMVSNPGPLSTGDKNREVFPIHLSEQIICWHRKIIGE